MNIIIFLVILLVLVLSHEFGHFIVAKKSGIRVDEFSFGFPPKLFGKKVGETSYNFNLIPFGGYVKIFGENPDEDSINGPDKNRSFVNKPKYIQAMVLFAGVFMNLLVAWVLLSFGLMSGLPTSSGAVPNGETLKNESLTVTSIVASSPAEKSGVKVGDKIISLESGDKLVNKISDNISAYDVQEFVKRNNDNEITISVKRGEELEIIKLTPEKIEGGDNKIIGISMDTIGTLSLPIHKAFWEGLKLTGHVTWATVLGFYNLIHDAILGKADMSAVTGPVGIVGVVGDAREFGFIYLLSFTALISVNLAVINLIPFPALDGGRLLFLLIEKIKGSRIKPEIANWVNTIGFGILMLLMIVITFHDVMKLF